MDDPPAAGVAEAIWDEAVPKVDESESRVVTSEPTIPSRSERQDRILDGRGTGRIATQVPNRHHLRISEKGQHSWAL